jgi:hypothetical protein
MTGETELAAIHGHDKMVLPLVPQVVAGDAGDPAINKLDPLLDHVSDRSVPFLTRRRIDINCRMGGPEVAIDQTEIDTPCGYTVVAGHAVPKIYIRVDLESVMLHILRTHCK